MTGERGTGRMRGAGPARARRAAWTVSVLVLAATGCGGGDDTDGGPTLSGQLAQERDRTTVAVPAQSPPDLVESWLTVAEGYPVVNLASRGAPTVTVCTGDPTGCAAVAEGSATIRTLQVDGRDVVVAVAAREEPSADSALPPELASFWAGVDLTTDLPDWLSST